MTATGITGTPQVLVPAGTWGFVLVPLFAHGVKNKCRRGTLCRLPCVVGIILNRINVSIIAPNWNLQHSITSFRLGNLLPF
jgi:hypothetical protein